MGTDTLDFEKIEEITPEQLLAEYAETDAGAIQNEVGGA